MNNVDLFSTPTKSKEFRKGVFAHKYPNGTINIEGQKYLTCSLTEAIAMHRKKFPIKRV